MLSPGKWHLRVPRDPIKNLRFRREMLKAAAKDGNVRAGLREAFRKDFLLFVNTMVWQYNPKRSPGFRVEPFVSWPFQDRLALDRPETTGRKGILWCVENGESGVCEKSREMGMSWWFLIVDDWLCRFTPHHQSLCISKSADAVDCKSPDSLFWKLRFIDENLPEWLKGEMTIQSMYFQYPNGSSRTGVASTGVAGVGGRAGTALIDEVQIIKEAQEVRERTASTASSRFFIGTHLGRNTELYRLTQTPEFVKFRIHWTRHPRKNQGLYSYDTEQSKLRWWEYDGKTDAIVELEKPKYHYPADFNFIMDGRPAGGFAPGIRSPWYDKQCQAIGSSRAVAMELDMDPEGSVEQFFDPLLIRDLLALCKPPLWEGSAIYDDFGNIKEFSKFPGGPLRLWVNLDIDGNLPKSSYCIAADVSGASGATPSCLSIFDSITGQKAGEFRDSTIEPGDFARLSVGLCRKFYGALLVWEHLGPGVRFGNTVIDLGYPWLYRKVKVDKLGQPRSDTYGWNPAGTSKSTMLREYNAALSRRECLNLSAEAIEECLIFKYDDRGDIVHVLEEAAKGSGASKNHGDMVMADGMAWMLVRQEGRLISTERKRQVKIEGNWIDPRTAEGRRRLDEKEDAEELPRVWQD